MTRRCAGLLLALLALCVAMPAHAAQAYSFPLAGVRLEAQDGWTVLTPDTLDEHAALLLSLGADADTLAADYAAGNIVFEVYLPQGGQVSLSAVQTEQTRAWGAVTHMSEADKAALLAARSRAPYQNARWADGFPGWIAYDWTMQAGGVAVTFAAMTTVRQGVLYTLTASGAGVQAQALAEQNAGLLARLSFLGADLSLENASASSLTAPAPIADDGAVTPIALEGFDTITYDDVTTFVIRTLPDAELVLYTSSDSLRGRADAGGRHQFQVSTRRESVYTYTITAKAADRKESRIEVSVDRRLTQAALDEAYRKSARAINVYGYSNLVATPQANAGKAVTFRGRVSAFTDMEGFPCVLIYTENPGKGVWRSPMWVMLAEAVTLEADDIRTVYGDLRGDTLPYTNDEGDEAMAPVVIGRVVTD